MWINRHLRNNEAKMGNIIKNVKEKVQKSKKVDKK